MKYEYNLKLVKKLQQGKNSETSTKITVRFLEFTRMEMPFGGQHNAHVCMTVHALQACVGIPKYRAGHGSLWGPATRKERKAYEPSWVGKMVLELLFTTFTISCLPMPCNPTLSPIFFPKIRLDCLVKLLTVQFKTQEHSLGLF